MEWTNAPPLRPESADSSRLQGFINFLGPSRFQVYAKGITASIKVGRALQLQRFNEAMDLIMSPECATTDEEKEAKTKFMKKWRR